MKFPIAFHVLVFVSIIDKVLPIRITSSVARSQSAANCLLPQIENGQARKTTSRIVRYTCDSEFLRVGPVFASCVGGKWNPAAPVCVSSGCDPLIPPTYSQMSSSHRGAAVRFICDPGYQLTGSPTIFCNQAHWNATTPTCDPIITNPVTSCDFESSDICGWTQDAKSDVFNWSVTHSKTPSGVWGTGPSFDHTFGEDNKGHYMYIEASRPRKENDTARLFSPVYNQDGQMDDVMCFQMWYHMYGAATGSMTVYLNVDDRLKQLWVATGDHGDQWLQAIIPFQPTANKTFQIVVEATRGAAYSGDSAVDDVSIQHGDNCTTSSTSSATDPDEVETDTVTPEVSTPVSYTSNYLQNITDINQPETTTPTQSLLTTSIITISTTTTPPAPQTTTNTTPMSTALPMTTSTTSTSMLSTTSKPSYTTSKMETSSVTLQPELCTNASTTSKSDEMADKLQSETKLPNTIAVDIPIAIGIAFGGIVSTALLIALIVRVNKREEKQVKYNFSTSELRFLTAEELIEESP